MGAQTSMGVSVLAGLFNVRLGYWWNSGVTPGDGRTHASFIGEFGHALTELFPAQMLLFDELLARFHGTALRYWYLSDGGHFENTAAYELIRRRVQVMVACDCGADPGYAFEDLGNLVRKARLDFNAEIVFVDPKSARDEWTRLLPEAVGTLNELRQTIASTSDGLLSTKHAALALVYYDGDPVAGSVLLLLKPTMTGDEPPDLMNYRSANGAFPQEPTAQQFFDEAQWESYRKLGELIGRDLFSNGDSGSPHWLWDVAGAATQAYPRAVSDASKSGAMP
jgi:hypothetical protein